MVDVSRGVTANRVFLLIGLGTLVTSLELLSGFSVRPSPRRGFEPPCGHDHVFFFFSSLHPVAESCAACRRLSVFFLDPIYISVFYLLLHSCSSILLVDLL